MQLMGFTLSGNRSLEEFTIVFARISLGVFFAISGRNKLFVASQYKLMYETIVGAGLPFPHVMTYFVSSIKFVCGCLLMIGVLSPVCCMASPGVARPLHRPGRGSCSRLNDASGDWRPPFSRLFANPGEPRIATLFPNHQRLRSHRLGRIRDLEHDPFRRKRSRH